jgi:hypothetical protein
LLLLAHHFFLLASLSNECFFILGASVGKKAGPVMGQKRNKQQSGDWYF